MRHPMVSLLALPLLTLSGCEDKSCVAETWEEAGFTSVPVTYDEAVLELVDSVPAVDASDVWLDWTSGVAGCTFDVWSMGIDEVEGVSGHLDQVYAIPFDLQNRAMLAPIRLFHDGDLHWATTLPDTIADMPCSKENRFAFVFLPILDDQIGSLEGTYGGQIRGYTKGSWGNASDISLATEANVVAVEGIIVNLTLREAGGPLDMVRDGEDLFGNKEWAMGENNAFCRTPDEVMLYGFAARNNKDNVVGAATF